MSYSTFLKLLIKYEMCIGNANSKYVLERGKKSWFQRIPTSLCCSGILRKHFFCRLPRLLPATRGISWGTYITQSLKPCTIANVVCAQKKRSCPLKPVFGSIVRRKDDPFSSLSPSPSSEHASFVTRREQRDGGDARDKAERNTTFHRAPHRMQIKLMGFYRDAVQS